MSSAILTQMMKAYSRGQMRAAGLDPDILIDESHLGSRDEFYANQLMKGKYHAPQNETRRQEHEAHGDGPSFHEA